MSEKRFRVNDLVKFDYSEIGEYVDEEHTDKPLRNDEVCDLLNEQQATINKQDEEIKKLKRTERSWRKIHCCNKESDNCGIVIEQQATIQSLKEENIELKKLRKYCAEWMGVKEENLYDVVR